MDWIQWYTVAFVVLSVASGLLMHGRLRTKLIVDFRETVIALAIFSPIFGRILGWW